MANNNNNNKIQKKKKPVTTMNLVNTQTNVQREGGGLMGGFEHTHIRMFVYKRPENKRAQKKS